MKFMTIKQGILVLAGGLFSLTLTPSFANSVLEDFNAETYNHMAFWRHAGGRYIDDQTHKLILSHSGSSYLNTWSRRRVRLANNGASNSIQVDVAVTSLSLADANTQNSYAGIGGGFYNTLAAPESESDEENVFVSVL